MTRRASVAACLALAACALPRCALADDGIPALLQFAEQYQQRSDTPTVTERHKPSAAPAHKASPRPATNKPAAPAAVTLTPRRSLQERDEQLARQRLELQALRQENAALRAAAHETPAPAALPDLTPLQQWLAGLRRAWQGTPDSRRAAELIKQAQQQGAQAEQQQREQAQRFAKERDAWRQLQAQWSITPEQLQDENHRLSYAAGSALGRDIQTMMTERQSWGVPVDRRSLLAGVLDNLTGRERLSPQVLNALMTKADAAAGAARERIVNAQQQRDREYVAQFSKRPGVQRSPTGFWYRVDYAGDRALAQDAVIDVVVKETLTDGTVIQDMDLNGKVLSLPLSGFPPLFREAIGRLRDHGSITMVVPPALAYGETGYPPKVPPNATMVYELRIDNSRAPQPAADR
ncbi:FKBP-type peptidyl-prolyl cis-trans isomerase N-terminal domain-containing protein [Serratia rubidaea]|uniref:FKBP-type peptidyl-prolyl cis-trans isomerase N-terminal domain-containing protein n=1 Tax=Serratia rubidaea TaxID=61652 RepID=UPI00234A193C|nr:FKBP-type peptidyl-prolyl cis-trans isomerase N-terminal domain-containing protein [Serratia rubidaea]MDC6108518.1 FKBP-type peptidyl-prolyl cis-trans isomerase N-terminal domain-containing protein [Serratia rubidaea]